MANTRSKGPKLYFSQVGGEQPIPSEFIAAMERKEEVQPVPNDVGAEPLSDTIVESKVETNRRDEWVRKTIKKKSGNIVLHKINTNQDGQPVQVTLTLFPTGTVADVPSATKNVAVQDLGNGWSIQESSVEGSYDGGGNFVPGVFSNNLFARERPNLVPEEFRPAIPTVTTRVDSAGTAIDPTLSGTELRESQEQTTQFKKRIEITTQASPALPVVLDKGRDTNQVKQDVTVTRTLMVDGTAAATATALKDVSVKQLGDGNKVQETREVAAVFGAATFEKQIPDVMPQEFRALLKLVTTSSLSAGTASAPTLGAGELQKKSEQVDSFVKRDSLTARDAASLPATLLGAAQVNGNNATVTKVLATGVQTITPDSDFTEAKVENLGDGTSVMVTVGGAKWTNSSGQIYDRALGLVTGTFVEKVVDAGVGVGDALTESQPQDKLLSRVKVYTPNTTNLDAFYQIFFGNATLELPPVLTQMVGIFPTDSGDGTGTETGTIVGADTASNAHLDLNCTNENSNSGAMIPEIVPLYKRGRFEDVRFTEYFFFVNSVATRANVFTKLGTLVGITVNEWPLFKPRETTFLLVGKQLTARASAAARVSIHISNSEASNGTSEGSNTEKHYGVTVRHITEPASLHAALNIVNTSGSVISDLTPTLSVSASAEAKVTDYVDASAVPVTVSGDCEIGFSPHDASTPIKMPATNYTDWPATGLYAKLDMTSFQDGYRAVRARIFDFADFYY